MMLELRLVVIHGVPVQLCACLQLLRPLISFHFAVAPLLLALIAYHARYPPDAFVQLLHRTFAFRSLASWHRCCQMFADANQPMDFDLSSTRAVADGVCLVIYC